MFDLLDKPLHWVTIKWPSLVAPEKQDDLSEAGENEVELRVELLDRDEAGWRFPGLFGDDFEFENPPPTEYADKDDPSKWGPTPTGVESFLRIVKDWRKIKAAGKTVEFNEKNARLLLQSAMFPAAFSIQYVLALGGRGQEREKNSDGSPSVGRADENTEATPETNSRKTATASA